MGIFESKQAEATPSDKIYKIGNEELANITSICGKVFRGYKEARYSTRLDGLGYNEIWLERNAFLLGLLDAAKEYSVMWTLPDNTAAIMNAYHEIHKKVEESVEYLEPQHGLKEAAATKRAEIEKLLEGNIESVKSLILKKFDKHLEYHRISLADVKNKSAEELLQMLSAEW